MERISLDEASRVHMVLSLSRSRGQDAVAVMDRGGLLRHEATRRADALRVMDSVILEIQATPGHEATTAMDMKNLIIAKIKEMRDDIAEKH